MTTDEVLLNRYTKTGDPAAFRELVDRYSGMVYHIGLRVTGDQHVAEDVCQECFLELARKARTVRENVAGWLHALATSRSLNVVRSRKRTTHREHAVARNAVADTESSEWRELQPLIDRALNGLSDDLRLPIILHYLRGESQQQVAERLGIDQATVSRRLQRGVEQLRSRLGRFGVMTTVVAMTSLFGQSSAQAASSSLTGTLAKIGVGGIGVTIGKSTPGGLLPSFVTLGAVVGNVLLFLFLRGWILVAILAIEFALLMRPPAWVRELLRAYAFGRDLVAHPMYPFRRWTWTVPPADWKQRLFVWSYVGFTFGLVAFGDSAKAATQPGFVVGFGLMAALFLALAVRLAWRVWTHREHLPGAADDRSEELRQWSSWENIGGAAVGALIATTWLLSIPHEELFTLSIGTVVLWTWFVACAGMAVWAFIDRRRRSDRDDVAINDAFSPSGSIEAKPVAQRDHLALIGCLTLMVVACLFSAIVPTALERLQPAKHGPPQPVMAASLGLIFSLLLLRRVVKARDQLPRPVSLPLLAFSVLTIALGAGLTAYGTWTARTGPKARAAAIPSGIPQRRQPVFQPRPSQLELIRKYAAETAVITVPDEQLPDGCYLHRYDNGFGFPMPAAERHA